MIDPLEEAKQKWQGVYQQAEDNWYDNRALNVIVIASAEEYINLLESTLQYTQEMKQYYMDMTKPPDKFHIDL